MVGLVEVVIASLRGAASSAFCLVHPRVIYERLVAEV
jgi:hypothetical protein